MPPRTRKSPPVPASFGTPPAPPKLVTPDTPPPAVAEPAEPAKSTRSRSRKPPAKTAAAKPAPEPSSTTSSPGEVRRQRSVYLTEELWQRARGFVAWVQYEEVDGEADTMADLVTEALEALMSRKEEQYNDGRSFRGPAKQLRRGAGSVGKVRLSTEVRKSWENRS